jgi:hypothetical protein
MTDDLDSRHDGGGGGGDGRKVKGCRWRVITATVVVLLVIHQLSTEIPSIRRSTTDYPTHAASLGSSASANGEQGTSKTNLTSTNTNTRRSSISIGGSIVDTPHNGTVENGFSEKNTSTGKTNERTDDTINININNNNLNHNHNHHTDDTEHILWKYRRDKNLTEFSTPITVLVWPLWDATVKKLSSDVIHIERNGVQESSVLRLATESAVVSISDPNIVWMTDTKYPYKYWCERFAKKIRQAQDVRRELNNNATTNNNNNNNNNNGTKNLPLQWPIFVVDFTDLTHYEACPPIEKAVGKDFVLYSKRSIIVERHWNKTTKWVELGERMPTVTQEGRSYLHTPLVARTDTIQTIQTLLKRNNNLSLADPIESLLDRPVDLSHFWASSTTTGAQQQQQHINPVASHLRDHINTLIWQLFLNNNNNNTSTNTNTNNTDTTKQKKKKKYTYFVGLVGTADMVGRRVAQVGFIEAMLRSKMIVVSQRDKWEDQYRLYEALVSGALVLTDRMVCLPRGLENGTSIVEFGSAEEFMRLVRYYLEHSHERIAIARRGREVAMSQHRSWQRMEEIILGRVVTKCARSNNNNNNNCPFVVHANETG